MKRALLLFSLLPAACEEPLSYGPAAPVVELRGSTVVLRDEIEGLVSDILFVGDTIVMVDAMADKPIVVVGHGEVIRAGGRGDGPGESRGLGRLSAVGDTVRVFDSVLNRVLKFSTQEPEPTIEASGFPKSEFLIRSIYWDDGKYIAGGLLGEYLFAVATADSFEGRGGAPEIVRDQHWVLRRRLSTAHTTLNPGLRRIAVAYMFTGHFIVASLDGETLSSNRYGDWPIEGGVVQHGSLYSPEIEDETLGYYGASSDDERIYALWVGRRMEDARREMSAEATDVHVFDWDGQLRRILRLDVPVVDVEVHADSLYGLVAEPIPEIRAWKLPAESSLQDRSSRP